MMRTIVLDDDMAGEQTTIFLRGQRKEDQIKFEDDWKHI